MLTLSTGSLSRHGLHRVFHFVKEVGYDGVDIEISANFDTRDGAYINKLIEETGIPVYALVLPPRVGKKDALIKYIHLAKEIGAKVIVIYPPRFFDFEHAQWIKRELPGLRKREGLKIAVMNAKAGKMFGFLPEHSLNSLNDLKKCKQVCLDTSNAHSLKEDLIRIYAKLQKEVVHIFLSNVHKGNDHALPIEGVLPLESFLTKLKQHTYKGAFSLRVKGKYLKEGKPEEVVKRLRQAKEFVEKYYK